MGMPFRSVAHSVLSLGVGERMPGSRRWEGAIILIICGSITHASFGTSSMRASRPSEHRCSKIRSHLHPIGTTAERNLSPSMDGYDHGKVSLLASFGSWTPLSPLRVRHHAHQNTVVLPPVSGRLSPPDEHARLRGVLVARAHVSLGVGKCCLPPLDGLSAR